MTLSPPPLTDSQAFVLKWLGEEDSSAYGECFGSDLDELVRQGLAVVGELPEGVPNGYQRVTLTGAGRAALSTPPKENDHE